MILMISVLVGTILGCAVIASAAVLHRYASQITEVPASSGAALTGVLAEPHALTVDSGDLYVAERPEAEGKGLNKFDASSGAFVSQFPQVPSLFLLNRGVAVGHSTGEAEVYVAGDESGGVGSEGAVAVFSGAGGLQAVWKGAGTPAKSFGCFGCGTTPESGSVVAVDASANLGDWAKGDVYVASPALGAVNVFKPGAGGKEPKEVVAPSLTGTCETLGTTCPGKMVPFVRPEGVAVSAFNGDVLVMDGGRVVDVFEPTGLNEYRFVQQLIGTPGGLFGEILSVAVDGGNGEIYVVERGVVDQFSATGVYLGQITGADTPGNGFRRAEAVAVDPVSHRVYVGDFRRSEQNSVIDVFGPDLVIPDVTTGPVSNLTPLSATLNGTVNPLGQGPSTCVFVWGTSRAFGRTAPCAAPVEGEVAVPVGVPVSGLEPDTTYFYRLQASNKNGENPGEASQDKEFTTPGPALRSESVSAVTAESVTLDATIDPHKALTSYYFQYGTSTSYEHSIPAPPGQSIGSAEGNREVSQHAQGLQPHTLYHYRVVVVSSIAGQEEEFVGRDQTFLTQIGGGELTLPDQRAWELVSPPDKHAAELGTIGEYGLIQAAPSGNAIGYYATATTEEEPEPQGNANLTQLLSTRGPTGWASRDLTVPHEHATEGSSSGGGEYRFFSTDLSLAVVQPAGPFVPSISPEASEQTPFLHTNYLNDNVNQRCTTASCYRPLVTGASGHANVPPGVRFGGCKNAGSCGPRFVRATPDGRHVILFSEVNLTTGAPEGALYEWSEGTLIFLGDPSPLGGFGPGDGFKVWWVSSDGSRVVFSGFSEGKEALLLRDVSRGETVWLDAVQGGKPSEPVGRVVFQSATGDGSKVMFTDDLPLTGDAGASSGRPDLYQCEIVVKVGRLACALSDLTPGGGVRGLVLAASKDGSAVYFVADGVLAPGARPGANHLYVRRGGVTKLIAGLSGADKSDWGNPEPPSEQPSITAQTARLSPDGDWLTFISQVSLTGYDNRDVVSGQLDEEVFLYHVSTGSLVCVSCNPSGARPHGAEYTRLNSGNGGLSGGNRIMPENVWVAGMVPGGTPFAVYLALYASRVLSDGGRMFFDSVDGLVPQDVNGTVDVYEFEPVGVGSCSVGSSTFVVVSGGCVGLVSSGTSGGESAFVDASESGSDVFFLTAGRLSGADRDTSLDLYDAHECSSMVPCFPASSAVSPPCVTAEACRTAPSPQPGVFGAPASATFSGAGNAKPSVASSPPLTRAQRLSKALRACRAKHDRRRRRACEAQAHRRYGSRARVKRSLTRVKHGKR